MKQKTKPHFYMIKVVWSVEDGCFIAEVPELEGCITSGNTPEEAVANSQDAIQSWLSAAKALGHPIPQPIHSRPVSGKFNVRLPKSLHRSLIEKALLEKVSLNQLIATRLAQASHS